MLRNNVPVSLEEIDELGKAMMLVKVIKSRVQDESLVIDKRVLESVPPDETGLLEVDGRFDFESRSLRPAFNEVVERRPDRGPRPKMKPKLNRNEYKINISFEFFILTLYTA